MSVEPQHKSEESLGSFCKCLVEGNPQQRNGERRVRRRAMAISILLQGAAVTAILLLPLFGKPERLVLAKDFIPLSPYRRSLSPAHRGPSSIPHRPSNNFTLCLTCSVPITPAHNSSTNIQPQSPEPLGEGDRAVGLNCSGCINMPGPEGPPQIRDETLQKRLQITHLDPAMLIHRVEPVYPTLARQAGRSGRVELRAIIATDGTIQFLQVVSGDALFIQSAIQAVQQWRYRPTILNGRPVEIDTFITVVYNINR